MGAYSRELSGLPSDLADVRCWPPPPRPPELVIRCARCPARATLVGWQYEMVRAEIRLWHHGWRRNPDTAEDHCPRCAVEHGVT